LPRQEGFFIYNKLRNSTSEVTIHVSVPTNSKIHLTIMKKCIVMLLAWAAVCLLSLPQVEPEETDVQGELSVAAPGFSITEVNIELFSKLP